MALLDEVSRRKRITVSVAAGKALVGHIEEGEVALLLDNVADLTPLVLGWVHTSRVVSASVQQDDAVRRSGLEVLDHALEVEANRVLVVVPVLVYFEAGVLEDRIVVGPARGREIDLLGVRIEALEESTAYSQGTGAGNGLGDNKAVFLDGGRVGSVGKLSSRLGKRRKTGDGGVLLVEARRNDFLFGSANRRKDVRLALVVTCEIGA